jgi:hypothetical protein
MIMKSWHSIVIVVVLLLMASSAAAVQPSKSDVAVPKYNQAAEATFKGTVEGVTDRICPVSGGLGSHVMLKLSDGQMIEVHLATTKFVESNQLLVHKGDEIVVIGNKVNFQGRDTIFAREVTRGVETFVFRDKEGNPAW